MPTLIREAAFGFKTAAIVLWAACAWATQVPPKPNLPANPVVLVRQAVNNELKSDTDNTHYTFRLTRKRPDRTETREMIETDHGVIGRLLLVDGKPLSPADREKEDKRLQRLLIDPQQLVQKQKSQKDDDRRTRNMVAALPDAFLYEYTGTEYQEPWGELVTLRFKSNPNFDPPHRETMVYRGMEGTMAISVSAYRIAKIEARLVRDVNFGWGILGHLDQGGRFIVEQKPVASNPTHWEPAHMVLNFTGKALLFKTIKINDDETTSGYRPVPDMTVAQAVELLKKRDGEVAQNGGDGTK
ncbi:MAG: hypothetical protein LAO06_16120 [Acidobacteriia bacterium]|nr:hypothetical protein [Terriglobia bacterium]